MAEDRQDGEYTVRYEPQEKAPHLLAAAMAGQTVILILTGIMLTPLVIARGAGLDAADTSWMVFAALVAAGLSTWLQLLGKGPIGSGYTLFVGSNVAFVAVAVTALQGGGIAELGLLGAVGALSTFAFSRWLPLLRRVLTPAVGGTVLMLMAAGNAFSGWLYPLAPQVGRAVPTCFICACPNPFSSLLSSCLSRFAGPHH
jgi:NCS2 family nucleobase:cation symporter-2/xanthine permease XanP